MHYGCKIIVAYSRMSFGFSIRFTAANFLVFFAFPWIKSD